MVFLVLCDFFGQIHSTSLNFSLQIGLWTKKRLVFVFVSILMTMSYMSLEIFSFEWIQILNGTKVWQYHRLSHHKIWATWIHIWFFEFHTILYLPVDVDHQIIIFGKKKIKVLKSFCQNKTIHTIFLLHCSNILG